jgi:hypothetical protein
VRRAALPGGSTGFFYGAQTWLLQLRVLRLGFFQDGDVGVGVGVFLSAAPSVLRVAKVGAAIVP